MYRGIVASASAIAWKWFYVRYWFNSEWNIVQLDSSMWHAFHDASFFYIFFIFGFFFYLQIVSLYFHRLHNAFHYQYPHVIKINHIIIEIASLLTGDRIRGGSMTLCQTFIASKQYDRLPIHIICKKKSQISSLTVFQNQIWPILFRLCFYVTYWTNLLTVYIKCR